MSEFIDTPQSTRTNQAVPDNGCPTCQGHRLIQVDDPEREVYTRCPTCNPAPTTTRPAVKVDGWWKE
jgi:hypothetical protein